MFQMIKYLPFTSGAGHHLLELLKVDASVAIGIDRSNHPRAITERTLLSETLKHGVQFTRGDESILVQVIEIESVPELLVSGFSVGNAGIGVRSSAAVKVGELLEINVAVPILVDLRHYALDLVWGGTGAECVEDMLKLVTGNFSIAIRVELVEYLLNVFHGSKRARSIRNRCFFSHGEEAQMNLRFREIGRAHV